MSEAPPLRLPGSPFHSILITHQLVTVTNDSYLNETSVCELLENIALQSYPQVIHE